MPWPRCSQSLIAGLHYKAMSREEVPTVKTFKSPFNFHALAAISYNGVLPLIFFPKNQHPNGTNMCDAMELLLEEIGARAKGVQCVLQHDNARYYFCK